MFEDENVDIIYITSPHNTHYAFMKKALQHGKHLLVEKSITLNSRELDQMITLAQEKNLILNIMKVKVVLYHCQQVIQTQELY